MLKKDIEKWLINNGFQVRIAQDTEYSYNFYEKIIYIGGDTVKTTAELFKHCLKQLGCLRVQEFNIHTLAFLHELGHYNTVSSFKNEELIFFATIKEIIATLHNDDEKTANLKYWNIPDELAANNWVVDFINTHYPIAKKLDTIMTLAN